MSPSMFRQIRSTLFFNYMSDHTSSSAIPLDQHVAVRELTRMETTEGAWRSRHAAFSREDGVPGVICIHLL